MKKSKKKDSKSKSTVETDAIVADFEVLPAESEVSALPIEAEVVEDTDLENKSNDVVVYDPLSAYLREMRQFPPLSREQEVALATRYREHHDLDAAYQLVSSNLWLVVKIAREYERAARTILDLIQEGNIGLMEAVKNFDPIRGVRFPSYAVWWIKAYIIRYLIANWRLVKIGTTQAQRKLFFNLNKEKERLEREGFKPEPKLIAQALDVKESEVIEMEQRLAGADMSVDAPINSDSSTTLMNLLTSDTENAEELYVAREQRELLLQSMHEFEKTLKDKELVIYKERLLNEEKATLQDLSEKLSLTRERVRQIEVRIKEKLKLYLIDKFGENLAEMV